MLSYLKVLRPLIVQTSFFRGMEHGDWWPYTWGRVGRKLCKLKKAFFEYSALLHGNSHIHPTNFLVSCISLSPPPLSSLPIGMHRWHMRDECFFTDANASRSKVQLRAAGVKCLTHRSKLQRSVCHPVFSYVDGVKYTLNHVFLTSREFFWHIVCHDTYRDFEWNKN